MSITAPCSYRPTTAWRTTDNVFNLKKTQTLKCHVTIFTKVVWKDRVHKNKPNKNHHYFWQFQDVFLSRGTGFLCFLLWWSLLRRWKCPKAHHTSNSLKPKGEGGCLLISPGRTGCYYLYISIVTFSVTKAGVIWGGEMQGEKWYEPEMVCQSVPCVMRGGGHWEGCQDTREQGQTGWVLSAHF